MRAPRRLGPLLIALAALPAGCGRDESTMARTESIAAPAAAPQRLMGPDRARIRRSEAVILAYCERAAEATAGARDAPSARRRAGALDAVDDLVALAGEKPDATLKAAVDVRLFVGDLTEDLEGANCDPAIVARLDAGLASIP